MAFNLSLSLPARFHLRKRLATAGGGGVEDTDSSGYPFADDGTVAGANGRSFAAANAPNYHVTPYTYTGSATGGEAMTAPAAATVLGSQAITVGAGKILAVEYLLKTPPADPFAVVYIGAYEVNAGAATGNVWATGFSRSGSTISVLALGSGGDTPPTNIDAAATGWRVGIDVNGDTGVVTLMWGKPGQPTTYGSRVSAGPAFTPGRKITFICAITDSGTTTAGRTIEVWAVPNAADMLLTHTSGATDHNNVAV